MVRHHSFVEIDHETCYKVILSPPLIQELEDQVRMPKKSVKVNWPARHDLNSVDGSLSSKPTKTLEPIVVVFF